MSSSANIQHSTFGERHQANHDAVSIPGTGRFRPRLVADASGRLHGRPRVADTTYFKRFPECEGV